MARGIGRLADGAKTRVNVPCVTHLSLAEDLWSQAYDEFEASRTKHTEEFLKTGDQKGKR